MQDMKHQNVGPGNPVWWIAGIIPSTLATQLKKGDLSVELHKDNHKSGVFPHLLYGAGILCHLADWWGRRCSTCGSSLSRRWNEVTPTLAGLCLEAGVLVIIPCCLRQNIVGVMVKTAEPGRIPRYMIHLERDSKIMKPRVLHLICY
jgi:hypothetical protein